MIKRSLFVKLLIVSFCLASCAHNVEEPKYKELTITPSHYSGFYDNDFTLKVLSDHTASIFYTLDGTEPTKESSKYNDGILVNKNTSKNLISDVRNISSLDDVYFPNYSVDKCNHLKIKGFDEFGNESKTLDLIYLIGFQNDEAYKNMPVICLDTDFDNLFDYEKGIYVTGKTYDEGKKEGYKETYPANYNNTGKEWERPARLTYFGEDHLYQFSQDIGIRIHGGWSRAFNQKSFNLYARKEYSGTSSFSKPFFSTKKLKTCMLRNGGYRDTTITKSRDWLNQTLSETLSFENQDSFPTILFLNGEYWGIYNLQERFSSSYIEEHYGISKDNVIIVQIDSIDEGNVTDLSLYTDMLSFFKDNDLSDDDLYLEAANIIDIEGFIEYMSVELICGNIDWPANNFRLWRSKDKGKLSKEDCRWRFMMYDTDDSSGIISKCNASSNPFENISHWKGGPLDTNCSIGLIFSSLLKNANFKDKFKDCFNELLNIFFSVSNVSSLLLDRSKLLSLPMAKHYKRFVSDDENIFNDKYFNDEINKIIDFYKIRKDYLVTYLNNL